MQRSPVIIHVFTCFHQQHFPLRDFRESRCHYSASRSTTHNNKVVLYIRSSARLKLSGNIIIIYLHNSAWCNKAHLWSPTGIIEITLRTDEHLEQSHEQHKRATSADTGQSRSNWRPCLTIAAGHGGVLVTSRNPAKRGRRRMRC